MSTSLSCSSGAHRRPSFPTRRSSDLILGFVAAAAGRDPAPHLVEAARLSAELGLGRWRQDLLAQLGRGEARPQFGETAIRADRKSTRLNSSHSQISYAVLCLKKKK